MMEVVSDNRVKVSVCCITYNHREYVEECLNGILMQQTSFEFELIVHDDLSTDGTDEILKRYHQKYSEKMRIIRPQANRYSSCTRAIATTYLLPIAKGEYIALCEGDDYWTDPFKLQKQVDILDSYRSCSVSIHASKVIEYGKRFKIYRAHRSGTIIPFEEVVRWRHNLSQTATVLYRKECMAGYPQFCLDCHVGDYPLMLWLALHGKIYYLSDVMSVYRRGNSSSWTTKDRNIDIENRLALLQTEFDMLDGFNEITKGVYEDSINRKKQMLLIYILWRYRDIEQLKNIGASTLFKILPIYKSLSIYLRVHIFRSFF